MHQQCCVSEGAGSFNIVLEGAEVFWHSSSQCSCFSTNKVASTKPLHFAGRVLGLVGLISLVQLLGSSEAVQVEFQHQVKRLRAAF